MLRNKLHCIVHCVVNLRWDTWRLQEHFQSSPVIFLGWHTCSLRHAGLCLPEQTQLIRPPFTAQRCWPRFRLTPALDFAGVRPFDAGFEFSPPSAPRWCFRGARTKAPIVCIYHALIWLHSQLTKLTSLNSRIRLCLTFHTIPLRYRVSGVYLHTNKVGILG